MAFKVVLISLLCLYTTNALFCQLFTNYPNSTLVESKNLSRCEGDLCLYQITKFDDGSKIELYGCFSGFNPVLGCKKENNKDGFVCFCNHSDYCNTEKVDNSMVSIIKEIKCNSGEIKNGKLLGNETCLGQACTLSVTNVTNKEIVKGVAGCSTDMLPAMYNNGCVSSFEKGSDGTWNCLCHTDFCNNASTVISKSDHTIKCALEDIFINSTGGETVIRANETCIGEYCFLIRAPGGSTKSCMTTTTGTKLSNKKFSSEMTDKWEIYICNHDWCNVNVETASKN